MQQHPFLPHPSTLRLGPRAWCRAHLALRTGIRAPHGSGNLALGELCYSSPASKFPDLWARWHSTLDWIWILGRGLSTPDLMHKLLQMLLHIWMQLELTHHLISSMQLSILWNKLSTRSRLIQSMALLSYFRTILFLSTSNIGVFLTWTFYFAGVLKK